jgi:phosphoglycerate kinase
MNISTISNSTVLVRVNFDLPSLEDTARIKDSISTIQILLDNNNKVVLLSHWGRPRGSDESLSLRLQLNTINDILKEHALPEATFYSQFPEFQNAANYILNQPQKSIILLENTRFDNREKSQDSNEQETLAKLYAQLGNHFVDEAFAVSHRAEVTNSKIKEFLPSSLGVSFEHEISSLSKLRDNPEHPFMIVMGGAKLETKLPLIQKMVIKADKILLSGLLAFTFLQAQKELYPHLEVAQVEFPRSLVEDSFLPIAKDILLNYPDKIILPRDFNYDGEVPFDVGEMTVSVFKEVLQSAKTIFWNGTLGKYEQEPFDKATRELADFIGNIPECYTAVGGGDTVSALDNQTLSNFKFVSMGGGATLELLGK